MDRPLSVWKESSSGLANGSQLVDSSSSVTPAVLDVTPVQSVPVVFHSATPAIIRSRREIFEDAIGVTLSRNKVALDELGKL
ncbi:MAG TPA: hypothetical protein PKO24_04345 [Methanomassiliicoccales archaeon]|jgi:hypothetical protein|nr:hypothetical protein [Euryarchaeota archaeon]HOE52844.1 hypothetical protein [Methanomassiliicoccales archaeon]HOO04016.1 hypothetical protein [Methanomassiliicoccales archaeon]HRR66317.1 hypothetical protein [Methanomassiliicoccales archaeon]